MNMMPEILSQANIPKPMHGVNPRTIMGRSKWDAFRTQVYASTGHRCAACGVHKSAALFHKWLEAHEDYSIDHKMGRMTVRSVQPLCHACHSFVHSGLLLEKFLTGKKSAVDVHMILRNGLSILESNDLPAFIGLSRVIEATNFPEQWRGKWIVPEYSEIPWSDWRMVWEGKEYPPIHSTYDAWKKHYRGAA